MPEGGSGSTGSLIPDPFNAAANVATEAIESTAEVLKTLLTPGKVNLPQATGDVLDIAGAMKQVGVDKKYLLKAQRMQNKHEIRMMQMQTRAAVVSTITTHPLFWLIAAGSTTYSAYFALKIAALRESKAYIDERGQMKYAPITAQEIVNILPDVDDLLSFIIPGMNRTVAGSETAGTAATWSWSAAGQKTGQFLVDPMGYAMGMYRGKVAEK